jgi:hypothetical protein
MRRKCTHELRRGCQSAIYPHVTIRDEIMSYSRNLLPTNFTNISSCGSNDSVADVLGKIVKEAVVTILLSNKRI